MWEKNQIMKNALKVKFLKINYNLKYKGLEENLVIIVMLSLHILIHNHRT